MDMSVIEKSNNITTNPPMESVAGTDRRRIILALPGDNFSSAFMMSLLASMNILLDNSKFQLIISPGVSSYVPFARMQTLGLNVLRGVDQKVFNGEEFDYWITIDSDQIFSPAHLVELIESLERLLKSLFDILLDRVI